MRRPHPSGAREGRILRVGVVGAGLAGIGAARILSQAGHEVRVFESQSEVGGRIQTVSHSGYLFDAGATSIAPMGQSLESVLLHELPTEELIRIEAPVVAHDGVRVFNGNVTASHIVRYTYQRGTQHAVTLMATGLDVRLNHKVECFDETSSGAYTLDGDEFDALVLTAPVPEVERLLARSREGRRFTNARFRSCLSVLLGFDSPFEARYHALVGPDQAHPLSWLSIESIKCPGRAPVGHTAMVAQMGAEYSRRRFDADDNLVLAETLSDVSRLLGKEFAQPRFSQVVRFKYSHPETTTSFEAVNSPMSRLVVAGDGLIGGRTELAYETGRRAARLLLENA